MYGVYHKESLNCRRNDGRNFFKRLSKVAKFVFSSTPYAKKCACNMHVTTNYMHVMVNMHVTLLLHECYMHVVQVLEMVAHVPCMLYEC